MKKNAVPRLFRRTTTLLATTALWAAGHSAELHAQTRAPNTPLPGFPGLTEVQQPVANAIDVVCPNLLDQVTPSVAPGATEQQRLAFSCTGMVVTSAVLQGKGNLFPPEVVASFNWGISPDQLRRVVQAAGPVQHNAQYQISTSAAKTNLLAARLFDLRAGARGFTANVDGMDTAVATSTTSNGATGGAASADPTFGGRLSGFVKVAGNWGKVDETTLQDAYKYDAWSVLGGVDYRVSDAFIIGGAVSFDDTSSRFDNSLGKVDAETWAVTGYATYSQGPWYVDGFVSFGSVDYDTRRTIDIPSNTSVPALHGSATASPRGDQWSLAIGTGYNFQQAGYTLVPFARLGYIHVKNKSFIEDEPVTGLALAVDSRTVESLQSALGATVSTTMNTSMGVFGPYFTAQWMHEFKNDNPSIVAKFVHDPLNLQFFIPTAKPTRNYAVLIVGSSATFANGLSGFLQFGAAAGLDDATNYGVVLGLRKEF